MITNKTLNVEFAFAGVRHGAEVKIGHASFARPNVAFDSTIAEVQSIDGRACLEVFADSADDYFAMCKLAKAAALAQQ